MIHQAVANYCGALKQSQTPEQTQVCGTNLCGSIEVRTTHEIMTARTPELALLVMQFMTAARTPTPMFASDIAGLDRASLT